MKRVFAVLLLAYAPVIACAQMLWTKPPTVDPASISGGSTITATSQFLAPDGSVGTPSYSWTNSATTGLWRGAANQIWVSTAGTSIARFISGGLYLDSGQTLTWESGVVGNGGDLFLARDAANTLRQANGASAQTFRVYGTTTGPKYLSLSHDGTNGVVDTAASAGIVSIAPTNATGVTIGKALTQATSITSSTATMTVAGLAAAAGGSVAINGGAGSSTTGGTVALTGGTATSGAGSTITLTGGSGAGGTNSGGDVNLIPGAAVSTGTPGEVKINSARGFFDACWQQYLPASVPVTGTSYTFFMANRAYRVVAASIINSSASTVPTVDVTKDTGTTAPGAGSTVLTGVMTFSATANTRVAGSIIGTVATTNLAAGDRLAAKWAGTVGSITGAMVCVTLVPI